MQVHGLGFLVYIEQSRRPLDDIVQVTASSLIPTPTATRTPTATPTPVPPVVMIDSGLAADVSGVWGGYYTSLLRWGDYLFSSQANRLVVFRYSDPNRVEIVSTLDLPANPRQLAVVGQTLHLLFPNSLQVIDVSSPATPTPIDSYALQGTASAMVAYGQYTYVINSAPRQLDILYRNPSGGITEAGSIDLDGNYTHMLVHAGFLYLAESNHIKILSLSNPAMPEQVGQYDLPWSFGYWAMMDQVLLIAKENSGSVLLLDVSTPGHPTEVAQHIGLLGSLSAIEVNGTRLYVASGARVTLWDFGDQLNPIRTGSANHSISEDYGRTSLIVKDSSILVMQGDQLHLYDFSLPSQPIHLLTKSARKEFGQVVAATKSHIYLQDGRRLSVFAVDQNAAVSSGEMLLLGWVDFDSGVSDGGLAINDRYGYAASGDTLVVIDLYNPRQPQSIHSQTLEGTGAHRLVYANEYLYVSERIEKRYGLRIYDLSNPAEPVPVGFLDLEIDSTLTDLAAKESLLILRMSNQPTVVQVYSIADQISPKVIGTLSLNSSLDTVNLGEQGRIYVRVSRNIQLYDGRQPSLPLIKTLITTLLPAEKITALGSQLYLINQNSQIYIVDWSLPTNPQIRRYIDVPISINQELIFNGANTLYGSSAYNEILSLSLFDTEGYALGMAGGNLVSIDGRVSYSIPASTFHGDVWFSHAQLNIPTVQLPAEKILVAGVYENRVTSPGSGSDAFIYQPYTIGFSYTLPESLRLSMEQPPEPLLYRWNGSMWVWQPDATVDADAGHLTASVQQTGRWAVMIPDTSRPMYKNYLPTISRASNVDLSITHIEVTQAIQTLDNRVPLVAHRPTIARIYATTTDPEATAGVHLALEGHRDGQPLPGSPLTAGPWAIYAQPQRDSFGYTVNLPLPLEWTEGNIDLVARIDTAASVAEINETNNRYGVPVSFQNVPPLELTLVPIAYTERRTGRFFPAPTEDQVSDWVMRSYPIHQVNVSWHTPLAFEGDLLIDEEWFRLLNQVTSVKRAEGAPESRIYYGLIPERNSDGESPSLAWLGLGWIGERVSMSVTYGGSVAAHEIGHNFGLLHAPCGVNGGDKEYPYPYASIGEYGLDLWQMQIFPPDIYRDVMSYCRPEWFSDYNYVKLFQDQMRDGRSAREHTVETGAGLLIRANLSDEVSLLPVYALPDMILSAPVEETNHTYSVELLDSNGVILARHPVVVISAEEYGHVAQYVNTVVPFPMSGQLSLVRLLRAEQVVAERDFHAEGITERSAPYLDQSESIWTFKWDNADTPALVRYRMDEKSEWIVLALDWTGGRLAIDPRRLPGGLVIFDLVYADNAQPQSRSRAPTISLPNQTPTVWIRGENEIGVGNPLYIQGHAYDPEDGILSVVQWFLDGVPISTQSILQLNQLSVGEHSVILRAVDSQGQTVEAVHRVQVKP